MSSEERQSAQSPDNESLLQAARAAMERGDSARAYELASRVIASDAANVPAWMIRATTTSDVAETVEALQWVLLIEPANMDARRLLERWTGVNPLTRIVSEAPSEQVPRAEESLPLAFTPADSDSLEALSDQITQEGHLAAAPSHEPEELTLDDLPFVKMPSLYDQAGVDLTAPLTTDWTPPQTELIDQMPKQRDVTAPPSTTADVNLAETESPVRAYPDQPPIDATTFLTQIPETDSTSAEAETLDTHVRDFGAPAEMEEVTFPTPELVESAVEQAIPTGEQAQAIESVDADQVAFPTPSLTAPAVEEAAPAAEQVVESIEIDEVPFATPDIGAYIPEKSDAIAERLRNLGRRKESTALVRAEALGVTPVPPSEQAAREAQETLQRINQLIESAQEAEDQGRQAEALSLYRQVLEVDPFQEQAVMGLARTATEPVDILRSQLAQLRLHPDNQTLRETVRKPFEELGARPADASEQGWAQTVTSNELVELAKQGMAQGFRELAYPLFVRASELQPNLEEAWLYRARLASTFDEHIAGLQQVLEINPDNQQAQLELDSALKQKEAEVNRDDVTQLMALGQSLALGQTRASGEHGGSYRRRAYELFCRVAELQPENAEAWLWRARTTTDEAERQHCLQRVLAINPNDERALGWLGYGPGTLAGERVRQTAEKLVDEAEEALRNNQSSEAHALLKRATTIDPQLARAWLLLSRVTTDPEEKFEAVSQVLKLDPANEEAREELKLTRLQVLRKRADVSAEIAERKPTGILPLLMRRLGKIEQRLFPQAVKPATSAQAKQAARRSRNRYMLMLLLLALLLLAVLWSLNTFVITGVFGAGDAASANLRMQTATAQAQAAIPIATDTATPISTPTRPLPTRTPSPTPLKLATGKFNALGPLGVPIKSVWSSNSALYVISQSADGDWLRLGNGQRIWQSVKANLPGFSASSSVLAVDPSAPDTLYHVTPSEPALLQRSDDGAKQWRTVRQLDVPGKVTQLAVAPRNTLYLGTNQGRIYRSRDAGLNWQLISADVPGSRGTVTQIAPFAAQPDLVYVTYESTTLFVASGDAKSWSEATYRFEVSERYVNVLPDAVDPNVRFALGQSGGVYVNAARGWSLLRASTPDEGQPIALLADPADNKTLFLVYQRSALVSANWGEAWQRLPLPGSTITSASIRSGGLALGTGSGILVYESYR